jgi:hypothetical protein
MKYCPKCGALLDGRFECSCGFVIDEEELIKNPGGSTIGTVGTGMMTELNDASYRISINEDRLDKILKSIKNLEIAVNDFNANKKNIELLNSYYESKDWLSDKDSYENKKISNLKAGVLSEDSVWNMNEDIKDLINEMKDIVSNFER